MSRSMAAHERSSSSRLLAVRRIKSNRFGAMCVWFASPGSILGCTTKGTVIEEQKVLGKVLEVICTELINH